MAAIPRFDPLTFRPRFEGKGFVARPPLILAASRLLEPDPESLAPRVARRTRIWDLSHHLHCSIVGTCLSTGELRQVLAKAGSAAEAASDHDLHGQGVALAGQRDGAAKLLHKALDRKHRTPSRASTRPGRSTRCARCGGTPSGTATSPAPTGRR